MVCVDLPSVYENWIKVETCGSVCQVFERTTHMPSLGSVKPGTRLIQLGLIAFFPWKCIFPCCTQVVTSVRSAGLVREHPITLYPKGDGVGSELWIEGKVG